MAGNGRVAFSRDDQRNMLQFLVRELRAGNSDLPRGNVLWKLAESQRVTLHSFQSMRDHMRRVLLPRLEADKDNEVPLSAEQVMYVKRKLQLGSYLAAPANNKSKKRPRALDAAILQPPPQAQLTQQGQSPRTKSGEFSMSLSVSPQSEKSLQGDTDSPKRRRRRVVVLDSDSDEGALAADGAEASCSRSVVPVLQCLDDAAVPAASAGDVPSTSNGGAAAANSVPHTLTLHKRPSMESKQGSPQSAVAEAAAPKPAKQVKANNGATAPTAPPSQMVDTAPSKRERMLGSPQSPAAEAAAPIKPASQNGATAPSAPLPPPPQMVDKAPSKRAVTTETPAPKKTALLDACIHDLDAVAALCTRNGQAVNVSNDSTPRPLQAEPTTAPEAAAAVAEEGSGAENERLSTESLKSTFYNMVRDRLIPANQVSSAYAQVKSMIVQSASIAELTAAASGGGGGGRPKN